MKIQDVKAFGGWLLGATVLILWGGVSAAQSIVHSFDGDTGPGLAECQAGGTHCGRQPEHNVAANGEQVVQVTWRNVRIYNYDGKLLQSMSLADLIRSAGLDPMPKGGRGPFEAHVVFNEFIGRWIISVSCYSDCLLASATSDARDRWGGGVPLLPERWSVPRSQSGAQTRLRQERRVLLRGPRR